jgi:RNA polymerase sigma factor (TIGR02999 family)
MRRILIDHARRRGAQRRGGSWKRMPLELTEVAESMNLDQILAVDEAIRDLEEPFPRAAEVVRLRFFAGLNEPETARTLEISERTVRREWTFARAWLLKRLTGSTEG